MRKLWFPAGIGTMFLLVLWGCGSHGNVASKAYSAQCWPIEDTLSGTFEVNSTSEKFLMYFPITATDDYPYYNLHVRAEIIPPSGKKNDPEQLEFQLITQEGDWINDCEGKDCQFNLEWGIERTFEETGTHTIKLYHFMRDQPLCGIKEIGVEVRTIE